MCSGHVLLLNGISSEGVEGMHAAASGISKRVRRDRPDRYRLKDEIRGQTNQHQRQTRRSLVIALSEGDNNLSNETMLSTARGVVGAK